MFTTSQSNMQGRHGKNPSWDNSEKLNSYFRCKFGFLLMSRLWVPSSVLLQSHGLVEVIRYNPQLKQGHLQHVTQVNDQVAFEDLQEGTSQPLRVPVPVLHHPHNTEVLPDM